MAVRRLSTQKTLHIVYDSEYATNPDFGQHLPDLSTPFEQLGYTVLNHFITPSTVREDLKSVPRDDRDHLVFMHIDMPKNAPLGTRLDTARYIIPLVLSDGRYIEKEFTYVAGFRSDYCEKCTWVTIRHFGA
jgi:hypothetical protein